MRKRIISALLLCAMLMTMLPTYAFAEEAVPVDDDPVITVPEPEETPAPSETPDPETTEPEPEETADPETGEPQDTASGVSLPDGVPIVIGYAAVDYGADLILKEIDLDGLSDTQKIQKVYDWVIQNCERDGTGGEYYNPDDYEDEIEAYRQAVSARLSDGTAVQRQELIGTLYEGETDLYDELADSNFNIEYFALSMMETRVGNCMNFTSLLTVLLGHLGYDSRVINGEFINSDGSGVEHKWSCVLVNGKYYWLDVRMDHSYYKSLGTITHTFFMKTDKASWQNTHDWNEDYSDWLFANAGTIEKYVHPTPLNGWQKIDGKWYYYVNNNPVTGWKKVSGSWYYFDDTGVMKTGWQKIDGSWYHFTSAGAMQKGWQKIGGSWYWFWSSGVMKTGWKQINNVWYYFGSTGRMTTGWLKISGSWYHFTSTGAMQKGWQKLGSSWYFFNSDGSMKASSWKKYGGKWYYFQSSGKMAVSCTLTIRGVEYTFDENGVWIEDA